jgi:ATP-binding cassette, subfamily C (CFTR/MRP), member 1
MIFYTVLQLFTAFSIVVYFTNGLFLLILCPMMIFYFGLQKLYRQTSREVKRIEALSRSPLYAHTSESIVGISTIRAYNAIKKYVKLTAISVILNKTRFASKTQHLADKYCAALFLIYCGHRWSQIRMDMIGNVLVFSAALYASANPVMQLYILSSFSLKKCIH